MDPLVFGPDGKVVLPEPEDLSSKETSDAMGAYLMMFTTMVIGLPLPFLNIIAAIIYFALNARSRFVAFHAYQSLISQIGVSLLNSALIMWTIWGLIHLAVGGATSFFDTGYWVFLSVLASLNIVYFILSLVAMVNANRGLLFYLPVVGKMSFERYYGQSARHRDGTSTLREDKNRPPG